MDVSIFPLFFERERVWKKRERVWKSGNILREREREKGVKKWEYWDGCLNIPTFFWEREGVKKAREGVKKWEYFEREREREGVKKWEYFERERVWKKRERVWKSGNILRETGCEKKRERVWKSGNIWERERGCEKSERGCEKVGIFWREREREGVEKWEYCNIPRGRIIVFWTLIRLATYYPG